MWLHQIAAIQILAIPHPTTTRGHTKTPPSIESGVKTNGEFALAPRMGGQCELELGQWAES